MLVKNLCTSESICPSGDCTVSGSPISSDHYFATYNINSSGTVENGGNVLFTAGHDVQLNAGFIVEAGGLFEASIAPCNP